MPSPAQICNCPTVFGTSEVWVMALAAAGAVMMGLLTAAVVPDLIDRYRNPSRFTGGWDWF